MLKKLHTYVRSAFGSVDPLAHMLVNQAIKSLENGHNLAAMELLQEALTLQDSALLKQVVDELKGVDRNYIVLGD